MMLRFRRHALAFGALAMVVGGLSVVSPAGVVDAAGPPVASLPTDNPANWTPNVLDGQVNSIWQFGNKVVVGGTFTQIANSTSNGGTVYNQAYLAAFDATTGVVDAGFDPVLNNHVEAIVPGTDANTLFVGGAFNTVDGTFRRKVAKLNLSNGSLVEAFDADGVNGQVDGTTMKRTFNGTTFGPGSSLDNWSNNIMGDLPTMTGIFFDPATASVYYTVDGQSSLYRRAFLPESGVLHAEPSTVTTGNVGTLNPSRVAGMFLADGRLYFVDENSGNLFSMAWNNGAPTGSATSENSTADWRARALFLALASSGNTPPTADIAAPICDDNVCEFDGTGSSDSDGTIVSHEWDFGDGGLTGTGASTSHTYTAGDTYTVTLTVTDDQGAIDTDQVVVNPSDPPNEAPTAAIATPSCVDNVCEFDGTGSSDSDGTIASYLWYFGDGDTGTGPNPSHAYTTGGKYTVELVVTDDDGASASTEISVTVTAANNPIVPVVPARVLETRSGPAFQTIDGKAQGIGRRTAGTVTALNVTGRGGVPANADAVILNVTAVSPTAAGYLTVYPCGTARPLASNVNYTAGQVIPNSVLAKIGTAGKVCIFTLAATDIVIDVNGYVPDGASPSTVVPARVLETRSGPAFQTIDGKAQGIGRRTAGTVTALNVTGRGGVPANADAVILNVTAVSPTAAGYLTVYPCGTARPLASNVNYTAGQVIPNSVLAKIGTAGKVCIFTLAATDIVIDVNGYVPDGASPSTVVPARVLETRSGPAFQTIDGKAQGIGRRTAGTVTALNVTGRGGVPANADAVILNVTAVSPTAAGYLTVYPCGTARPLASNVNYTAGQVIPNSVLAKIGTAGKVCIFTLAATDIVIDVNGYV